MLPTVPMVFLAVFYREELQMAQYVDTRTPMTQAQIDALTHYGLVSSIMSFLLLILALVWFVPVGATKQKTGMHDLIARTRVVKV